MCNCLAIMSKTIILMAHEGMSKESSEIVDFENKLRDSQEDMPPEFKKVLNDNYWNLLL